MPGTKALKERRIVSERLAFVLQALALLQHSFLSYKEYEDNPSTQRMQKERDELKARLKVLDTEDPYLKGMTWIPSTL